MKRGLVTITILLPTLLLTIQPAFAEININVSGNGNASSNAITASSTQTTSVTQTNTTAATTNVTETVDTGHNTASSNSSNAQIMTGNASSQTSVASNTNSSVVSDTNCCATTNTTAQIKDNGINSDNKVNLTQTNDTDVHDMQTAAVANNITIYGNTGYNVANGNGGSVSISTGSVNGVVNLSNSVNSSNIIVPSGGSSDLTINVAKNGEASINNVVLNLLGGVTVLKNENASITNNIYADLNTGKNVAISNLNTVLIQTGDSFINISANNGPINTSNTDILCCENGQPMPPNQPPQPPTSPPAAPPAGGGSSGSGAAGTGGSSTSSVGSVLSAMINTLPSTGASAIHFWIMAVVYLLTFLSGLYLRLRAGRSPDFQGYRFTLPL